MQAHPAPIGVSVNGVPIANGDIAREVQNHDGETPRDSWQAATRALVVRELLLQRARALGLAAAPRTEGIARETEDEALIRQLLEREVHAPQADEATCRHFFLANARRFRSPDLFEPMHILFKAAASDQPAFAAAHVRAEAVLAQVIANPGSFATLARSLSDCPSGADGGRLGQIVRGETTPEFDAALAALQPGEICTSPVRTRYGVHVLRLERKIVGEDLSFDRVRAKIGAWLDEGAARRAAVQYIALLARQARIDGFEIAGGTPPPVQ